MEVLSTILGFFGRVIGSIVAPWSKWWIEEKRDLRAKRQDQIKRWREFMTDEFDQLAFSGTTVYSEMRPHLSEHTLNSIEGGNVSVVLGRGGNVIKSLVLDDIVRLEKEWRLI